MRSGRSEAAERAINSPLLDDIDLSGARGILVNITAGLDLSLGEFSEVGATIEDIASEDATVVVGTVIDPEMTDSLKVTVVATGLRSGEARPSLTAVEPTADSEASGDNGCGLRGLRPASRQASGDHVQQWMARRRSRWTRTSMSSLFDVPAFLASPG